uniref:Uncharacterized protein n=1 Tax=Rhizophora mucronata TaxID=61149 RepID=A0A2P2PBR5_RHIMU
MLCLSLMAICHSVLGWHQTPWPCAKEERSFLWKMCVINNGPFLALKSLVCSAFLIDMVE